MVRTRRFRTLYLAFALLVPATMPAHAVDRPEASADVLNEAMAAIAKGDFAGARQALEPFANSGDSDAQNLLGLLYLRGEGVARNPSEAARLFHVSADHGNKRSQFQLGRLLLEGVGVERDEVEAFRYFELSARQGVAPAQLALGSLLNPGTFEGNPGLPGVLESVDGPPLAGGQAQKIPKDAIMSAYWYRLAADQGNPDAQFSLAIAYQEGRGVPLNPITAAGLYRLAAEQGHAGAANNLGLILASGQGADRNLLKAYMWLVIAASSGNVKATDNRSSMSARLTSPQRGQAEQLAAQCIETRFQTCD